MNILKIYRRDFGDSSLMQSGVILQLNSEAHKSRLVCHQCILPPRRSFVLILKSKEKTEEDWS